MSRAEEYLEVYQQHIVALRRADDAGPEVGAAYASAFAAFGAGFLLGAGMVQAAATLAHCYRHAYPGQPFPIIWEGEA